MLELHIWGPAFSLPSIDPHCNAAVVYLNLALPKDQWVLIPSSNPLLSPTGQLPALRDGTIWTAGFRGIVSYLQRKSHGSVDLDVSLSPVEKAESIAFTSFIELHGQTLLDLSLYLTPHNFDTTTRRAYAPLLPFPLQYTTPLSHRRLCLSRTVHPAPPSSSSSPPSPAAAAAALIKLTPLLTAFLAPLQARLGGKRYLLGQEPGSVDCVAVAFLAGCFYPRVPDEWVAVEMKARWGRICAWLQDVRSVVLGGAVDVGVVMAGGGAGEGGGGLPWGRVERWDLPWVLGELVAGVAGVVWRGGGGEVKVGEVVGEEERRRRRVQRVKGVLTVAGGVAAWVGFCLWSGVVEIRFAGKEKGEGGEVEEGEAGYGMAEAILGIGRGGGGEGEGEGEEEGEKGEKEEHDEDEDGVLVEIEEAMEMEMEAEEKEGEME